MEITILINRIANVFLRLGTFWEDDTTVISLLGMKRRNVSFKATLPSTGNTLKSIEAVASMRPQHHRNRI